MFNETLVQHLTVYLLLRLSNRQQPVYLLLSLSKRRQHVYLLPKLSNRPQPEYLLLRLSNPQQPVYLLLRLSFLVREELSLFLRTDVFISISGVFFFIVFRPLLCFLELLAMIEASRSAISCSTS